MSLEGIGRVHIHKRRDTRGFDGLWAADQPVLDAVQAVTATPPRFGVIQGRQDVPVASTARQNPPPFGLRRPEKIAESRREAVTNVNTTFAFGYFEWNNNTI